MWLVLRWQMNKVIVFLELVEKSLPTLTKYGISVLKKRVELKELKNKVKEQESGKNNPDNASK